MDFAVSHLVHQGLSTNKLIALPKELGVELYCELGNQFYWENLLPRLMEGRTGPLCIHGPMMNYDLSLEELNYPAVKEQYRWICEFFGPWGAKHIVCHPYGYVPIASMAPGEAQRRRKVTLERVVDLHEMVQGYGMTLLVENMAHNDDLMNQQQFLDTFAPVQELRFLMDTGHMNIQHWDIDLCFRTIGHRILGYHLNDNFTDADSHLMAYEGSFDWERFFACYRQYTPDATLVCEYRYGPLDRIVGSIDDIRRQLNA